jgi:ABC-type amino acid transport substrate-binding protein
MKMIITIVLATLMLGLLYACTPGNGNVNPTSTSLVIDRILQTGELTVGTAASMPPLNMTTRDGKIIGLEADLARYMAGSMGVQLKLKARQFSKLPPAPFHSGLFRNIILTSAILVRWPQSGGDDEYVKSQAVFPSTDTSLRIMDVKYRPNKNFLFKLS